MVVNSKYSLSEGQKQAIAEIDRKIFELQLQKAAILSVTPLKCKIELDEEEDLRDKHEWVKVNPLFGERIIDPNVVVKIVPYEKEKRSDDLC